MSVVILFILILVFIYLYLTRDYGYVLVYILFFQDISLILFSDIGFEYGRYVLYVILLISYIIFSFRDEFRLSKIKYSLSSYIFYGLLALIVGMLIHYYFLDIKDPFGYQIVQGFFMRNLPLIIITLFFISNEKNMHQIGDGLVLWGLFLFIILIFVSGITELSLDDRMGIRDLTHTNPISYSRLYGMIFIVSIINYLNTRHRLKYIYIITMIASLFVILYTASRGPIIAVMISLVIYYIVKSDNKLKILKTLIISIIALFSIFLILTTYQFNILDRFLQLQHYQDMARYHRIIIVVNSLSDIGMFGLGPGGFRFLVGGVSNYAHNIILELILEYGIFGLISLLLITVSSFYSFFECIKSNEINYRIEVIFPIWLMYLLSALVSGYVTSNRELWVLTGMIVSINYLNKYKRKATMLRE